MAGNTSSPGASVVSRALSLLYAFDERHRTLTLTQMATRARLPLPTAHRLASELVVGGALARRPSGEYVVGQRLWDIGLLTPLHRGLREVASPFLSDLHAATRATVHLAIRDGTEALYLERVSGRASVPVISTVGSRLPMHPTGVGKVLLAHAPLEVQEQALSVLERFTPYTVTQPSRMRSQLDRVRRDGYAFTAQELTFGAYSVAVPIQKRTSMRGSGDVVASIGIVVPTLRGTRTRLVAALQVAAEGVARTLSGRP
jgi:DNA-binding IclR family transcriptional regulator